VVITSAGKAQVHGRTPDMPATPARISDAGQEVRDMRAHILLTGEYRCPKRR